jgi:hypothetical protein
MSRSAWGFDPAAVLAFAERIKFGLSAQAVVDEWVRRSRGHATALGFDQERRLLAEEYLATHHFDYSQTHLVLALPLLDSLDIETLRTRLKSFVSRHGLLTTSFGKQPRADTVERDVLVADSFHSGVAAVDLYEARSASAQLVPVEECHVQALHSDPFGSAMIEAIWRASGQAFDLAAPPFLRLVILNQRAAQRLLVMIGDRLIFDWQRLAHVASWVHEGECGCALAAHDAPIASRRDVRRQKRLVLNSIRYWHQQWSEGLGAPLTPADLPYSPPPTLLGASSEFAHQSVIIDTELAAALRGRAPTLGISLEVLIAGAIVAMLYAETRRSRLAIWMEMSPVAPDPSWRLTNSSHMHVVGVDLASARTVLDIIRTVALAHSAALPHSGIPLDTVWIAAKRSWLMKAPPVSFVHLGPPKHDGPRPADPCWPLPLFETGPTPSLQVYSRDNGLDIRLGLGYRPDAVRDNVASRMLKVIRQCLSVLALADDEQGRNTDVAPLGTHFSARPVAQHDRAQPVGRLPALVNETPREHQW